MAEELDSSALLKAMDEAAARNSGLGADSKVLDSVIGGGEEKEAEETEEPAAEEAAETTEAATEKEESAAETQEEEVEEISPEQFNELAESQFGRPAEEITEILADYENKANEVEELKKQLAAKQDFKDENQKRLFDFVSKYDGDNLRGIEDFARLQSLNITSLDDKSALREAYILENSDLSREDAAIRFERKYRKDYELDEEDAVLIPGDAKKARQKLEKIKEETKVTQSSKDKEVQPDPKKEAFDRAISENKPKYLRELSSEIDGFDRVDLTIGDNKVYFPLEKEEISQVKATVELFINTTANYGPDGKLLQPVAQLKKTAINILFGDEIQKAAYIQGQKDKQIEMERARAGQTPKPLKQPGAAPLTKHKSSEDAIAAAIMGIK